MRLVFAGTPAFAGVALEALLGAGHDVVLAMSQPDRPSGRGLAVHPTPVKAVALAHGIDCIQPKGLRLGGRYDGDAVVAQARLAATPHDAMIVAAYGLILPPSVLAIPPRGCLNIHASLLPRWRGAAPIQRAIEAGDAETGITIMQMDEGLDTGPLLLDRRLAIAPDDTAATLTDRLGRLGGDAIVEALVSLATGGLTARPQHPPGDDAAVTYAAKLAKSEARLDFDRPSRVLVDRIRAFDPWPGCSADLVDDGTGARTPFRIWHAVVATESAGAALDRTAGRVSSWHGTGGMGPVTVATRDGAIAVTELQKPGGKRLAARFFERDFAAGRALRFATPVD